MMDHEIISQTLCYDLARDNQMDNQKIETHVRAIDIDVKARDNDVRARDNDELKLMDRFNDLKLEIMMTSN